MNTETRTLLFLLFFAPRCTWQMACIETLIFNKYANICSDFVSYCSQPFCCNRSFERNLHKQCLRNEQNWIEYGLHAQTKPKRTSEFLTFGQSLNMFFFQRHYLVFRLYLRCWWSRWRKLRRGDRATETGEDGGRFEIWRKYSVGNSWTDGEAKKMAGRRLLFEPHLFHWYLTNTFK